MDINRNQVFLVGLVLIFVGVQFRMIDAMVLSPKATKVLAEQFGHPGAAAVDRVEAFLGKEPVLPARIVRPPEWLGWMLLSLGGVFVLQSFTMAKPA